MKRPPGAAKTKNFADRFSAIGAEPRLRIIQSLLVAPQGQKTVGEIQGGNRDTLVDAIPSSGEAQDGASGNHTARRVIPLVQGQWQSS